MGGGPVGSSSDQRTKTPAFENAAARDAASQSRAYAHEGYVPYQGPDLAALAPQQLNAMQQSNDWSSAFGMAPQMDVASQYAAGMPAQTSMGGVSGFSSFPGYEDALERLKTTYPGLYNYIQRFAINPETGKTPEGGFFQWKGKSPNKQDQQFYADLGKGSGK